jgi:Fic-DOC domain mobile mystery protein B
MDVDKDSILYTPKGATPIDYDDLQFLIPKIRTRGQLNVVEQRNIIDAKQKAIDSRNMRRGLLTIEHLMLLHEWMFNEVWTWAGKFRTRVTNIGVETHQIREEIAKLCKDAETWVEHNTYPLEKRAVVFHHRMVKIHLFANGNGRHARLVADLLMIYNDQPEFTWGGESLDVEGEARDRYLAAPDKADGGSYNDLMEFAKAD